MGVLMFLQIIKIKTIWITSFNTLLVVWSPVPIEINEIRKRLEKQQLVVAAKTVTVAVYNFTLDLRF